MKVRDVRQCMGFSRPMPRVAAFKAQGIILR
jgi:hypothetical protein